MQYAVLKPQTSEDIINEGVSENPCSQEGFVKKEVQTQVWPQAAPVQQSAQDGIQVIVLAAVRGEENQEQADSQDGSIGPPNGFDSNAVCFSCQA